MRSRLSLSPIGGTLRRLQSTTRKYVTQQQTGITLHCNSALPNVTLCYTALHHVTINHVTFYTLLKCVLLHFFHRTDEAFTTLQSAMETFRNQTDNHGMLLFIQPTLACAYNTHETGYFQFQISLQNTLVSKSG